MDHLPVYWQVLIGSIPHVLTLAALAYTVWRGTTELAAWRTQQRESLASAVAEEVAVATLTFLQTLTIATTCNDVAKYQPLTDAHSAFVSARRRSFVVLDSKVEQLLVDVYDVYVHLDADVSREDTRRRIAELQPKVRDALGPHVTLTGTRT